MFSIHVHLAIQKRFFILFNRRKTTVMKTMLGVIQLIELALFLDTKHLSRSSVYILIIQKKNSGIH